MVAVAGPLAVVAFDTGTFVELLVEAVVLALLG